MENEALKFKTIDKKNLLETMSQLSIGITNEKQSITKDIQDEIEKIPDYLTKRNKPFKNILSQVVSTINTTKSNTVDEVEELRKISILIYKIIVTQNYHLRWATYLKSGLGKLITPSEQPSLLYSTTVTIWPKVLKILLSSAGINKSNENEMCMNFVNQHLHELDNQVKQYQIELKIQLNKFHDNTLTIQQTIETYIQENLQSFRMKITHQIELLHYDYHIRAVKLEYLRQNPNEYQIKLMKEVCQSEYEQETTAQELNFLKQQITYYNLPSQSFQCCPSIAHSPLIDSIENPIVRQEFFKQFKEIAEQSRADLFNVYLKSAEDQQKESKKKYETNVKKMFSSQHSLNNKERISSMMIQLINQRCQKINERIKCIYKFKIESFNSNLK